MINKPVPERILYTQNQLDSVFNLPLPKDDEYNIALSFPGHDSVVVISKGREVLEVLELERFFNLKNIDWSQKFQMNYPTETYERPNSSLFKLYLRQVGEYIKSRYPVQFKYGFMLDKNLKKFVDEEILLTDYFNVGEVIYVHHHGAHAQGALYQSNFDRALAITYDGGSPDASCLNFFSLRKNDRPKLVGTSDVSIVKFYANLGLLFNEIKYSLERCNFSYPGKIMALSSYGNINYDAVSLYEKYLVGIKDDNFSEYLKKLDFSQFPEIYVKHLYKLKELKPTFYEPIIIHTTLLKDLLESENIKNVYELLPLCDKTWTKSYMPDTDDEAKKQYIDSIERVKGQKCYDMAATMQYTFETVFFNKALPVIEKFSNRPIILSGGGALNIVLNTKVKDRTNRKVFIGPDPSDCGLGLGAMLSYLRPEQPYSNPYTGFPILDIDMLSSYLMEHAGIAKSDQYKVIDQISSKLDILAKHISNGMIFGVVRGRSERGPRALGNRSIICSATIPHMRDKLNYKVKFREWYRPFAPIVRLEDVNLYFDWEGESRYMNFCIKVKEEFKKTLSPVTHVDGTARVQTITNEQNEFIYKLLTEMDKLTGVGVLINTSFNVNNKPIINSLKDAFHMLQNTELDGIIVEDTLILKK